MTSAHIKDKEEYIIWCDVETTGVDIDSDYLLEVGGVITDMQGRILGKGFQEVVHYGSQLGSVVNKCNDYVTEMHTKSGLFEALWEGGVTLSRLDTLFTQWVHAVVEDNGGDFQNAQFYFGGRSITFDRNVLAQHLPLSFNIFSHRSIDTTTLTLLLSRNEIDVPEQSVWVRDADHRALADCLDCITQYRSIVCSLPHKPGTPLPEEVEEENTVVDIADIDSVEGSEDTVDTDNTEPKPKKSGFFSLDDDDPIYGL